MGRIRHIDVLHRSTNRTETGYVVISIMGSRRRERHIGKPYVSFQLLPLFWCSTWTFSWGTMLDRFAKCACHTPPGRAG